MSHPTCIIYSLFCFSCFARINGINVKEKNKDVQNNHFLTDLRTRIFVTGDSENADYFYFYVYNNSKKATHMFSVELNVCAVRGRRGGVESLRSPQQHFHTLD